jgi:5-formyltetrahydrofolate cyclo-ligase
VVHTNLTAAIQNNAENKMTKLESNVPRDNCISLAAIKRNLRAELISRRSAMTLVQHATASAVIVTQLAQIILKLVASGRDITVGLYWPIKNEVDVRNLVDRLVTTGNGTLLQWALPVIEPGSNSIVYGLWRPEEPVVKGALGIMQPAQFNLAEVDVMLVPCVGFNDRGYRLGYGGGFFDRTLNKNKALTIGVAFELCRCDWVPEEHDRPLQTIVTESTTATFSL